MELTYSSDWVEVRPGYSFLEIGIYLAEVRERDGFHSWYVDSDRGDGRTVGEGKAFDKATAWKAAETSIRTHHANASRD